MAITIIEKSGTFDTRYDYRRQFSGPFDILTVFTDTNISDLQKTDNYLYNGEFLANNEPNKDTKPYFVTIKNGVVAITEISLVGHTHDNYAATNHTHDNYAATNHNHDGKYATFNHTHNPSGASSSQISDLENRVAKLESLIGFNVGGSDLTTTSSTLTPTVTPTGDSTVTVTPTVTPTGDSTVTVTPTVTPTGDSTVTVTPTVTPLGGGTSGNETVTATATSTSVSPK